MSATLLAIIQAIAYAVAKGCTEAYLDAIKERSTAIEESPNDEDRANADRFKSAVERLRSSSTSSAEFDNPTSDK